MEVILKEDVLNLGYKDDVVNVKKGYARNYLIPQGKAVIATDSAKKVLAENLKQRAHKLEQIKTDAQTLAQKLEGVSLTIGAKTSSTGTIFGSVNSIQIADALKEKGFEVDSRSASAPSTSSPQPDSFGLAPRVKRNLARSPIPRNRAF